jgi:hypothetical protein
MFFLFKKTFKSFGNLIESDLNEIIVVKYEEKNIYNHVIIDIE